MAAEGINLSAVADMLVWWMLRMSNISERRERVLATLPDDTLEVRQVRASLLRLFPDAHRTERRVFGGKSGYGSKGGYGYNGHRSAQPYVYESSDVCYPGQSV